MVLQPILLETSPGCVEAAILHMAEVEDVRHAEQRAVAMLDRSPIHTLLYSRSGQILHASKAVVTKITSLRAGAQGQAICVRSFLHHACLPPFVMCR